MKKLFYAVTGAVFLGLTAPVIGATGEAWAEEVIGPDVLVPEGYRNGEQGRDAVKEYLKNNPELADRIEAEVRANSFKLMSKQSQIAARAAGRAVDVSADDFEDGADGQ